jgi:hypothetical protein
MSHDIHGDGISEIEGGTIGKGIENFFKNTISNSMV